MIFPEMEFMEKLTEIEPGPIAMTTLALHLGRTMNLSKMPDADGFCIWCNTTKLTGRQRRWCGPSCVESGYRYTNPQSPGPKAFVLIHAQACACAFCGLDYTDKVRKIIRDHHAHNVRMKELYKDFRKAIGTEVSYHQVGYNTGDIWHVDHRIPIHQGGRGIGFDNIQVICVECHREKTARENSMRAIND